MFDPNTDKRMCLMIGCGKRRCRASRIVRLDANAAVNPDIVATIPPLPPEVTCRKWDTISMIHFIEHVTYSEAKQLLCECRRILQPTGKLILEAPDISKAGLVVSTISGIPTRRQVRFGLQAMFGVPDKTGMGHKWGYSPASLTAELRAAGYTGIVEEPARNHIRARDFRLVATISPINATVPTEPSRSEALPQSGTGRIAIIAIGGTRGGDMFPLWAECVANTRDLCDGVVVRFDKRTGNASLLVAIKAMLGGKLIRLIESDTIWNRWNWREDLLRALDPIRPEIVLTPDQDETFGDGIEADLVALASHPTARGLVFRYQMATLDGVAVPRYPGAPHMKTFRWQPGLTYYPYHQYGLVTQYADRNLWLRASSRMTHWCFATADMRTGPRWDKCNSRQENR